MTSNLQPHFSSGQNKLMVSNIIQPVFLWNNLDKKIILSMFSLAFLKEAYCCLYINWT